jgi:hypothetical protein
MRASLMALVCAGLCLASGRAEGGTRGWGGRSSAGGGGVGQGLPGWYTCEVSVAPALPTVGDSVEVTAGGEWPHMPTPLYERCEMAGHVIEMHFVYDPPEVVLPVVMLWGEMVEVGMLSRGSYEVRAYINGACCASGSFTVYDEVWRAYLPVVAREG